jgi:hypothetical protein
MLPRRGLFWLAIQMDAEDDFFFNPYGKVTLPRPLPPASEDTEEPTKVPQ